VRFDLRLEDSAPKTVSVPDVAGEAVRALWEERRWKSGLDELARSASGVLLFIKANDIVQPLRVQRAMDPKARRQPVLDEEPDFAAIPFDPGGSPTQVKLVDLIRAVLDLRATRRLRLAIVISAWDMVTQEEVTPLELIRLRMPLLWQYLASNPELIVFRTYGVSAQGGDFENPSDSERLLSVEPPAKRAIVVGEDIASHDVSHPLRWLWSLQ